MSVLTGMGKGLLALVAPVKFIAKQGKALGISPPALWLWRLAVIAGCLVGLGFLSNYYFAKHPDLDFAGLPKWSYFPGFFLLFPCATGCIIWLIWRQLTAEESEAAYPAIDKAWAQACEALGKAGIEIANTPLFFVLGRPEAAENFLFEGAKLQLTVAQTPPEADAPLHVYANRDAIFVTCARSCLLGKHAANLALEGLATQPAPEERQPMDALDADDGTVVPRGQGKRLANQVRMFATQGQQLRPLQLRLIRNNAGKPTANLLEQAAEVAQLQGALAHLCRLIVRDRQPQCPLNGILVLLPLGGTDTDRDAKLTAEIVQRDLAVARRIFQLHCPLFAIVCDMESIPGFGDFVRRQGKRFGRVGRSFPLKSDLQGEALFRAVQDTIESYFVIGLRELVYPLFDVQTNGQGDAVNRNLYLLLDQMRERKDRLARVLAQGLRTTDDAPLLFGGCYLAATGTTEPEQAYIKGVLNRLYHDKEGTQDFVQWSEEAFRADAAYESRAGCGYTLLFLLFLLGAGAGAYWFFWGWGPANRKNAK
jgi:hypothetical protein